MHVKSGISGLFVRCLLRCARGSDRCPSILSAPVGNAGMVIGDRHSKSAAASGSLLDVASLQPTRKHVQQKERTKRRGIINNTGRYSSIHRHPHPLFSFPFTIRLDPTLESSFPRVLPLSIHPPVRKYDASAVRKAMAVRLKRTK